MKSFAHASGVVSTMTPLLIFLKLDQYRNNKEWVAGFLDMVVTVIKELEVMELLMATHYVHIPPATPTITTKPTNMDDIFD